MNEKDLLFLGIGGLAVYAFLKMRNEPKDTITQTIIPNVETVKGTITPLSKVGGNPKNEEQPLISTNNAQQPPTVIETMHK